MTRVTERGEVLANEVGQSLAGVERIRASFPALEREHAGVPVAYFDGPGGTQVPSQVIRAMTDYLVRHNANTAWQYPSSIETDEMLLAARRALADFLDATTEEITFGQNMTSLTFHLARALGRRWGSGDEIVVTELDHHANVAPWQWLAKERGVTVRTARMDPDRGELDWSDLERQITPRTRLLAIGAASNALGTITDVKRASEVARAAGAELFVDAVHYAPHELPSVRELDCDFLVCSAYKFYGPHVGVLYGRRDLVESLDVPKLDPAPDWAPERLETGTQNHEGVVGAAAAVDFLASLAPGHTRRARLAHALQGLHGRGAMLVARMWDGLSGIPGVRLYGVPPDAPRTPTIAYTVDGTTSSSVARRLVDRGIFASNGDFYATTLVERLGHAADGLVRAGCACYTTEDEVDRLIEATAEIAAR